MTRIIDAQKLDFKDVLIVPKRSELSSRAEVSLTRKFKFKHAGAYEGTPIMAANMDGVGTFAMARALLKYDMFTCLVKHHELSDLVKFFRWADSENHLYHLAYSLGISDSDLEKYDAFKTEARHKFVCIDVANGYTEKFIEFCKRFRDNNPDKTIIAGNVVTPEMIEALLLAGVDIVKVGIGSGSVCSTRIKTGVGYPQLSAVIECADAAHGLGGHIVSDGGCTCPGDVAKAFGAGSDFCMLGSMLSATDAGETEVYVLDGKQYVQFYGMSSKTAQTQHGSSLKEYRASEGRLLNVPYKGSIDSVIQDILGGLRSTCTYIGSNSIKELPKRTTFIRVSSQFNASLGLGDLNG